MKNLIYEKYDSVALVKINRPQVLNALNREVLIELTCFLDLLEKVKQTRVLILTGEGNKAFIAGADIKEMQGMSTEEMWEFCELGQKVANQLENSAFVTIAAVNGYALGGGLEMALACDFIYASKTATLGLPEVKLGLIPDFGGTQRLSRAIGTRLAKELILTGRNLTAEQAQQYGIVNHVSSPEDLLSDCAKTAQEIIVHSAIATRQVKRVIDRGYSLGMTEALELEKSMGALCFATPERIEAMKDFVEKKAPK